MDAPSSRGVSHVPLFSPPGRLSLCSAFTSKVPRHDRPGESRRRGRHSGELDGCTEGRQPVIAPARCRPAALLIPGRREVRGTVRASKRVCVSPPVAAPRARVRSACAGQRPGCCAMRRPIETSRKCAPGGPPGILPVRRFPAPRLLRALGDTASVGDTPSASNRADAHTRTCDLGRRHPSSALCPAAGSSHTIRFGPVDVGDAPASASQTRAGAHRAHRSTIVGPECS